jgi:hypothetical protein
MTLSETWWVGLTAARDNTLLFHTYLNKGGNPDHKNLIAFDIFRRNVRWEISEFSFFDWNEKEIWGYRTGEELVQATIDIESGVLTEQAWIPAPASEGAHVIRPVRYAEGSAFFETVGKFIRQRTNHHPLKGIEYLEWKQWMMVSVYVEEAESLANYLLVFSLEGEVLLEVKLGEKLPGLGTDTFFMLSGCLFLIKNKSELAAYTFYD